MKKTKKVFVLQAMAAMAVFVGGCGSGSTDTKVASGGSDSSASSIGECTPVKDKVKIGFIVKSMADSWFQTETTFAKEEAAKLGVDLSVQEAKQGDQVLSTIDTMATNGVQGIIICAPETQEGTAIKAATNRHKIHLMSVDDRLLGADSKPLQEVPHLGIDAKKIGGQVGDAIAGEMKRRGWKPEEVGALAITVETLQTAKERVAGAEDALSTAGFKKENFFDTPWSGADIASASDAANATITAHSNIKKWVLFSSNDDGVLGGIRSLTNRGIPTTDIIGVGINGPLAAAEWAKGTPTGMYASILLEAKVHGASTVDAMNDWIKTCKAPPKETYTSGVVIHSGDYKDAMAKAGVPLK
jgi:L-arabinose transport system substrate-binding protein